MIHDLRCAARRCRNVEPVLREASDDTVIINEPVLAQHDFVAQTTDAQLRPGIGVKQLQEFRRVRSDHFDLAKSGRIEDTGMIAHGNALAVDRCVHVLAGLWIVPGAFPLADILELSALCSVPRMHGCAARRIKQVMTGVVHDRAESDWRERRAERG